MSLSKKSNMDALIMSAAHVLIDDTADYMRSIDTSDTVISKKLDKRIHRLIWQHTAENYWSMVPVGVRKAVAAVLVFCTISFATCMSVEAVREDMWNTILKWCDKFVAVFHITDATTPNRIEEFKEPTLQLAGTERIVEIQTDTLNQIKYMHDDEIGMLFLQKLITNQSVDLDAEGGCICESVRIGNTDGTIFMYEDGIKTITWHDNEYVYMIYVYLPDIDAVSMIQIAASVK